MKVNIRGCTYDRICTRFIQYSKEDYLSKLDSKTDTFGTSNRVYVSTLEIKGCLYYRESSELHEVTVRKAGVNSRCLFHRGVY